MLPGLLHLQGTGHAAFENGAVDGQGDLQPVEIKAEMAVKGDGAVVVLQHPQKEPVVARGFDGGEQPPHDIGAVTLAMALVRR